MAAFLEVVDVHKRYGATPALDGVSFQVSQGELFGLLGPNGAGKTTLLSILSCLVEPDSGAVRLLGQPINPSNRAVRPLIGIVPQELAIYDELTGRENLLFFGELYGLSGPSLERQVDQILQAVGLAERGNHRTRTYSGGMKRRLNLGVALVHKPRLLLLDEPTVGVDPQSRNHIFEEVRRLNAGGMTIVYTSHYMEEVQALCPRIGIMDQGRLRACDTLATLLHQLDARIRVRIAEYPGTLRLALQSLPNCQVVQPDGRGCDQGVLLELRCRDMKTTLIGLIAVLKEAQIDPLSLETEEPNLERVFLHLTGHDLRD